ncbi:dATP/dGTP pyrophosphohydrolase domain-containing protein [Kosakonia cowanii]|uniref:dATP/dGTP pyrophosphohydrolase domain-containing protein n=1 Tax=Kosakonia cowanii TaxID=208223 RepID=UPI0035E3C8EF
MLKAEPVTAATVPEEKGSSLQLRNLIRKRHAEWSQKAFGNVGPVGPLKHLAKEAIEAAEAPHDLSEWADMQFLLWDAQRRAGISDAEITAAMEEKLKVNMARQWPEPKDGEPRLHIKPEQEV